MPWESRKGRGRYYHRKYRRNGKTFKEYFGIGPVAEQAAAEDAQRAANIRAQRKARQTDEESWQMAQHPLDQLSQLTSILLQGTLIAAGYYQHDRGEWRLNRHENEDC
jgi:hypothetical protein